MRTLSRASQALFSTTILLTSPSLVSAQNSESYELGTLVLSAAGVATDPLTAPASVTVLKGADLEAESYTDLTDAVEDEAGVFVDNNDNITFRGLRAEDTLILIDGQRVNTRQSRTNGSGGLDQLYVPPASAIDRIEVVRGPMSSLYGSEALGGVVNIITKPVAEAWTGSLTFESLIPESSEDRRSNQASFYLSGPLVGDAVGLKLWGRTLGRNSSTDVGSSDRDLTDLNAVLNWVIAPDHEVSLRYGRSDTTNEDESLRGSTMVSTLREDERETLGLGYEGYLSGWDVTALLAYEKAKRATPTSSVGRIIDFETTTLDVKASRELEWHGLHQFTVGGQYLSSDLTDMNLGSTDTTQRFEFSNSQTSLFVEDIWSITDRFDLTLGARYTDDERFGGKLTPRIWGSYELASDFYINGGISSGYKTPELRDANENYYLPTNGSRSGDAIQGNPDLKAESSRNYEFGLRFDNGQSSFSATMFQIDFDDKIDSQLVATGGAPQGGDLYRYVNVDHVRNRGLEFAAGHFLTNNLELSGSVTLLESEQRSGVFAGQPLNRTPETQAKLRLDWQSPAPELALWGTANYIGTSLSASQDRTGAVVVSDYDSYATVDIGANYRVNDSVSLSGAIYNLTDRDINSDDHGKTQNGRTFWVSLTTKF
ncbi:Colicin I receptor [Sulfitobacter sp. DSM 110093]|uniref:TonB-dependent receptor domain-containing protein n=1 Tax=Sulfitobacter sp. DSM 110093 TaxID=2883127 RepID=UPI001FAB8F7D|nr:TonB-dependent receptor [Sulfitobacter sp. DSM 110093]UOA32796.1 Colicin I receptor [Sulfitobacter sp. DSM 110093]